MNPLSQWRLTRNRPDLYAIAGEYVVRRDAFRYADIPGSADTVGWQIGVFYRQDSSVPSVLWVGDVADNEILRETADKLMDALGFPVRIGDRIADHAWLWEIPFVRDDDFWENTVEYHFCPDDECRLTLGVTDGSVSKIEWMADREIIASVREVRWLSDENK